MDSTAPWPPPDPLGEALHFLRMSGAFYSRAEMTAPWGMTLTPMPGHLWFHVVVSGRVLLETDDAEPVWLQPRDLALVPHGNGHRLRSEEGAPAPDVMEMDMQHVSERYEVIHHGAGGSPATLVCGAVKFDHPAARHLVGILPRLITVDSTDPSRTNRVHGAVQLMAAEAREFQPGGEAVITRLADILVIQAIRTWIDHDPAARSGWLGALQDPQVGGALALIHRDPAREWSVASLAEAVAMSRSAFAARFTDLVGEPAMQYVTRWRMQVAASALATEDVTVGELAYRLGYRSEAAFARAFKRVIGQSPGRVRAAV